MIEDKCEVCSEPGVIRMMDYHSDIGVTYHWYCRTHGLYEQGKGRLDK